MQSCLREICVLTAGHEFQVKGRHLSGEANRVADMLSRWDMDPYTQLRKLQKDTELCKKSAFAEGTYKNLKVQFVSYFLFCTYFNMSPLPTSVNTLCLYGNFLSRSFKSVVSIQNYISGVKILHLLLGFEFPTEDWFSIKLLFRGLSRQNPHMPHRALPITPHILLKMYEFFDMSKPSDVTFWCCFLFAFFLMVRKSNLVPTSAKNFDPRKQLCRNNVIVYSDYLLVKMEWSKTIQFGNRKLELPLVKIKDSPLCPYNADNRMCTLVPADVDDPAFLIPQAKSNNILCYSIFSEKTQRHFRNVWVRFF
ncbi:unnamed protein product [Mytilus coruscus]|uniref:Uncharacterized protein n=1 Tax=Mytilus coruscus TaxID=42192 RepID=A0A6J8A4X2_MYTCO|nr:unnamed protein product [Mytilus coruscus]